MRAKPSSLIASPRLVIPLNVLQLLGIGASLAIYPALRSLPLPAIALVLAPLLTIDYLASARRNLLLAVLALSANGVVLSIGAGLVLVSVAHQPQPGEADPLWAIKAAGTIACVLLPLISALGLIAHWPRRAAAG